MRASLRTLKNDVVEQFQLNTIPFTFLFFSHSSTVFQQPTINRQARERLSAIYTKGGGGFTYLFFVNKANSSRNSKNRTSTDLLILNSTVFIFGLILFNLIF
jgi:hypothetical protein